MNDSSKIYSVNGTTIVVDEMVQRMRDKVRETVDENTATTTIRSSRVAATMKPVEYFCFVYIAMNPVYISINLDTFIVCTVDWDSCLPCIL